MLENNRAFKAGDRVQVVANTWDANEFNHMYVKGTITKVDEYSLFPYVTKLDNGVVSIYSRGELKLVTEEEK